MWHKDHQEPLLHSKCMISVWLSESQSNEITENYTYRQYTKSDVGFLLQKTWQHWVHSPTNLPICSSWRIFGNVWASESATCYTTRIVFNSLVWGTCPSRRGTEYGTWSLFIRVHNHLYSCIFIYIHFLKFWTGTNLWQFWFSFLDSVNVTLLCTQMTPFSLLCAKLKNSKVYV